MVSCSRVSPAIPLACRGPSDLDFPLLRRSLLIGQNLQNLAAVLSLTRLADHRDERGQTCLSQATQAKKRQAFSWADGSSWPRGAETLAPTVCRVAVLLAMKLSAAAYDTECLPNHCSV